MTGIIAAGVSHLVIVDMQERLAPAVQDPGTLAARVALMAQAAGRLGVPVTATEQYRKGLGATLPVVAAALPEGARTIEKMTFDSCGEPAFMARIEALRGQGRDLAIVTGAEAHVCVLQTALGLVAAGCRVAVAADAVSSRRALDRDTGLARMAANGAAIVTAEMVVFEWLARAGTEDFRAMLPLIR
jgi:nicotinamidase-related amidase